MAEEFRVSLDWQNASDYCAGLDLGGHSTGWRLPELVELNSILDLSGDSGAAIKAVFAETATAGYWTSTEDPDHSDKAWALDFGTTEDNTFAKADAKNVRCVWTEVTP